jgi:hypothetical protein
MDLVGALSNTFRTSNLQRLTSRDWRQVRRQKRPSAAGWSDRRRPFGSVRDAILHVLAEADSDVRVRDIQAGVERLLEGPVSPTSVKTYLRRGCERRMPLFEYRGTNGYRLLR